MTFANPASFYALYALLPLAALSCLHYRLRFPLARRLAGNKPEVTALLKRRYLQSTLAFLGFLAALILTFSLPSRGVKRVAEQRRGLDIVLALDISGSMEVRDVTPPPGTAADTPEASRLERAVWLARSLIGSLTPDPSSDEAAIGSRFALALGKGDGILTVPLTGDTEALYAMLDSLSPAAMTSTGTNLENLLDAAASSFSDHFPTGRVLLLLTDGEALSGSLAAACERARRKNITLFLCGIGSAAGGPVPGLTPPVTSTRKEADLLSALTAGAGAYIDANSNSAPQELLALLRQDSAAANGLVYRDQPRRLSPLFALLAALLFGLSVLPRFTLRRR